MVMFHILTVIVILSFLCRFHSNSAVQKNATDHGPTNRQTKDRPSYRDAWTYLKREMRKLSHQGDSASHIVPRSH